MDLENMQKMYSDLLKEFSNQTKEYKVLKLELEDGQRRVTEFRAERTIESEVIVYEIEERRKRSRNAMMFNIPEFCSENLEVRIQHDIDDVTDVLKPANITSELVYKVVRVGEWTNKKGPLKIVFSSANVASSILKNKKKLI